MTVFRVVNVMDITNFTYNEVESPIHGTSLKACFTVLLLLCEICVENTWFKCKCQASDKVTSIHQIRFTHSFFLFLFQIKQEALDEERKKKEKEEEEAKAQVCNQGLIIKSSFWNRGIDIVFLCINSVKNVD